MSKKVFTRKSDADNSPLNDIVFSSNSNKSDLLCHQSQLGVHFLSVNLELKNNGMACNKNKTTNITQYNASFQKLYAIPITSIHIAHKIIVATAII